MHFVSDHKDEKQCLGWKDGEGQMNYSGVFEMSTKAWPAREEQAAQASWGTRVWEGWCGKKDAGWKEEPQGQLLRGLWTLLCWQWCITLRTRVGQCLILRNFTLATGEDKLGVSLRRNFPKLFTSWFRIQCNFCFLDPTFLSLMISLFKARDPVFLKHSLSSLQKCQRDSLLIFLSLLWSDVTITLFLGVFFPQDYCTYFIALSWACPENGLTSNAKVTELRAVAVSGKQGFSGLNVHGHCRSTLVKK